MRFSQTPSVKLEVFAVVEEAIREELDVEPENFLKPAWFFTPGETDEDIEVDISICETDIRERQPQDTGL